MNFAEEQQHSFSTSNSESHSYISQGMVDSRALESLTSSQMYTSARLNPTGATRSVRDLGTRVFYRNSPAGSLSERNLALVDSMNKSTLSEASMSVMSPRSMCAFQRRPGLFSVHKYASALASSLCEGSPKDRLTPKSVLSRIADNTKRSQAHLDRIQAYADIPKNPEVTSMTRSKDPNIANSARRLDPVSRELAATVAQIAHHVTRDESLAFGLDDTSIINGSHIVH